MTSLGRMWCGVAKEKVGRDVDCVYDGNDV